METLRFDKKAFRRLLHLAKPLFLEDTRWQAWGMVALLATFSITITLLSVLMSYINSYAITALQLKERDEFFYHLYRFIAVFVLTTPVVVFYSFTEQRFALMWRRWLSLRMLGHYFQNRAYYRINSVEGIDNPDQRIEEDIRTFTAQSLSILLIVFNSAIQLVAWSGVLWEMSMMLTLAALLYSMFGSATAYFIGRPLIGLNFAQLKKEADYRYKLVNVRDHAESIAFYRGEERELTRVRQRLKEALRNQIEIIGWFRNLMFFQKGYDYIMGVIPIILVGSLYLNGKVEFGRILQAGTAFAIVVNALSIIVLNFASLSNLTAVVTRLGTFWEALEQVSKPEVSGAKRIRVIEKPTIIFEHVTLSTPRKDQVLMRDLNFNLEDKSLLITGPSGSGKSSILRAIGGLWSYGEGTITRPKPESSIFLPQRPYMILGSFRSQFLYGIGKRGLPDKALMEVIQKAGLSGTLSRIGGFNGTHDWPNFLSTGEQQRLAFSRLLLAKPRFAFLDEATTAIDTRTEEYFYQLLGSFTKTYVSVGYRAALENYHDYILELSGDGGWKLEKSGAK